MAQRVGSFEVEVSGPHPCWVSIRYEGTQLPPIHHRELKDLAYALERAIAVGGRTYNPDAGRFSNLELE